MFSNKKIWLIAALLFVFSSLSVGLIYYKIDTYCISFLLIILIMPIISTRFLIGDVQAHFHKNRWTIGALIGVITGSIPATILIIVTILSYSASGGERISTSSKVAYDFMVFSFIGTWFFLLVISAFLGLFASFQPKKK